MRNEDGYEYKVLIVILTYNHELYIEEALKGVLMQQTDFPFVALVIDDCSQDRTTSIVRQYECMYPDLIKGIYHDTNYFSKGSASSLFSDDILFTWIGRAKYLASCEGDDYWTKSDKLQKQVDFLESHPDFSMCFHSAMVKWQDGSKPDSIFSNVETREYKPIEIFKDWLVPTASIVVRSDIFRNAKERLLSDSYKWVYTDIVIFLHCAVCGKVYGMNEVMSVYRRTEEGLTRTLERKCADEIGANDDVSNHYLSLIDLFGSQMGLHFKYICLYNYSLYNRKSALIALKQHNVDLFLKYLMASLRKSVVFTLYHYFAVFKWVIWKIALKLFKLDLKKIKKRLAG